MNSVNALNDTIGYIVNKCQIGIILTALFVFVDNRKSRLPTILYPGHYSMLAELTTVAFLYYNARTMDDQK